MDPFDTTRTDTPTRQHNLEVYNGEIRPDSSQSTGFHDEIKPVDETVESMANAAQTAHIADDMGIKSQSQVDVDDNLPNIGARPMLPDPEKTEEAKQVGGLFLRPGDELPEDLAAPKKKRKSKKRKPASKRGLGKPTGFEEYFVDSPMTPEQHVELQELYNPELPFVDRIMTAIQRFERTRKLSPERRDVFYKYLAYGGVDIGPNMFQGSQDVGNMDKTDISTALAQASMSDSKKAGILDSKANERIDSQLALSGQQTTDAQYEVDFETMMRAFLSRQLPAVWPLDTRDRVSLAVTTLERFLDYLLQNDVCPEYKAEVLSTRDFCREAQTDVWEIVEVHSLLPGDFNMACSTLFGGSFSENYDGKASWGDVPEGETVFVGLTEEKASQIVGFAIAGAADENTYTRYLGVTQLDEEATTDGQTNDTKRFEVIRVIKNQGFEITKIEQPSQDCLDLYKENTTEFRAVGRTHAKPWQNPDSPPEDLTPAEKAAQASSSTPHNYHLPTTEHETYTFFIESTTVLPLLKVGMKLEATIHELNIGVWFFDNVTRIYPAWDVWVENEMMMGWKEPKWLKGALDYVSDGENSDGDDHNEGDGGGAVNDGDGGGKLNNGDAVVGEGRKQNSIKDIQEDKVDEDEDEDGDIP